MECSVCGAKIHEGDKFCTSCGSPTDQMNPASESNVQVNARGSSDVPYSQPVMQYVRTDAPYNQPAVKVSQETNDQLNMKHIMHDHDKLIGKHHPYDGNTFSRVSFYIFSPCDFRNHRNNIQ